MEIRICLLSQFICSFPATRGMMSPEPVAEEIEMAESWAHRNDFDHVL
jgi:hypothetical protein